MSTTNVYSVGIDAKVFKIPKPNINFTELLPINCKVHHYIILLTKQSLNVTCIVHTFLPKGNNYKIIS